MAFLALTSFEAALLALAVASLVIALHFLKIYPHRVLVSSVVLWQRVLAEKFSRSLWERLQRIISILLAVTIALLIALSVGRPQIGAGNGKMRRVAIVLDTSPTMNARTADGNTRWKHAAEKARTLLAESPAAEFRIVDTSGETAFPFTRDRAEALQWIGRLSPANVKPRFPTLSGDASVYLISDGVALDDIPGHVESISVFERANNVAITAFEVRPVPSSPSAYQAYLEIRNYGQPADVRLSVKGADQEIITRSVRLLSDARFRDVFDLSNFRGGSIQAGIRATNDALSVDDVAFAYLPIQRKIRTLLVTRGNPYLETFLKLDPSVELFINNAQNYREPPDIDALIFDRFAPQTPPSKPALIFGLPGLPGVPRVSWLPAPQGIVQKPAITFWSRSHPIMQHLPDGELSIESATRIDSQNFAVVAGSKETPLIMLSDKPRRVLLTFDLSSSNFPLQSGFPIFMENVLAWFNREQVALNHSPGIVKLALPDAQVRDGDGKIIRSDRQLGETVFSANEPGLYSAAQEDNFVHIAVNLANPDLSNVNRSIFTSTAAVPRRSAWFD